MLGENMIAIVSTKPSKKVPNVISNFVVLLFVFPMIFFSLKSVCIFDAIEFVVFRRMIFHLQMKDPRNALLHF